ncbi:MAG: enoyl-CoA hydratase/isomerase family protein [Alphaproteobacteria bacterium]|nr:enoyl-CoA hydratase/isomerase family protein [Alphaproteobacteria bacterium]
MTGTVLSEDVAGGVRILTLNRPHRLNAIVPELLDDLVAALHGADRDPAVGAVVLAGAGRAFCSGDDLKEFEAQAGGEVETRAYIERIQEVTRAILMGDTPVIGAIQGWAVGGGLEWVINCDFAIAAEGTRFFFPEISWGLFVTGGVTHLLPRLVGLQRARRLILFGERFDAAEAEAWGLVAKIVPAAELMEEAVATARRIAALPAGPVRDLRRILAGRSGEGLGAAMAAETEATLRGFLDPATAKRIAAFQ